MESFSAEGVLFDRRGARPGWVTSEDGAVTGIGDGPCPVEPDARGLILTDVVNMHTHCADFGLRAPPGLTVEELVAPPDGLKHRYLREAPRGELERSMREFAEASRSSGSAAFVDFREGGAVGCRMLREATPDAVVLGRPVSPEFDPEEVAEILDVADGVGVSGMADMGRDYVEALADEVRSRGMLLGIHVSERAREDVESALSLEPSFVVHMCQACASDLEACADAGVPVVLCPTSNRYFGRSPPAATALACGAEVAVGTDNGMLCFPDAVAEALSVPELGPEEAFAALARTPGEILNYAESHRRTVSAPVSVFPSEGEDLLSGLHGPHRVLLTRRIRQWRSRRSSCPPTGARTTRRPCAGRWSSPS